MNKLIKFSNKAPVAISAPVAFGLFTVAAPVVKGGKPALNPNSLWLSPNH